MNFLIIGSLIISLMNQLCGANLLSELFSGKSVSKAMAQKFYDIQMEMDDVREDPDDSSKYVNFADGIASILIPKPSDKVLSLTKSIILQYFFSDPTKNQNEPTHSTTNLEKKNLNTIFKSGLKKNVSEIGQKIATYSATIIKKVTQSIHKLSVHVGSSSQNIIDVVSRVLHHRKHIYDLRKAINYFNIHYDDNVNCLFRNKCSIFEREIILEELILGGSDFRKKLATFVTQFIHTTETLPISVEPQNGFFHHLLYEYKQRAKAGLDCDVEMEQSEIYRLYLIITLTLEKSYSMVTAAHMIRYRENFNNRTLASSDFASAIKVLKQSNIDAIIVAKAAQAVINQSSTEIRRCEPSVHERGVTYDRFYQLYGSYIGFTYEHFLTPDATDIFIDNSLDQNSRKFLTPINDGLWGYTSQNLTHLLANRCQVNESISEITHFYDENDEERFYHHVQVFYKDGSNEIYGKLDTENNTLVVKHFENPFRSGKQYCLENCSSLVQTCPAIVRNSVRHVSLVPVEASPGHVITGIRWRISEKILYMEIQEGKYDNESFHIHTVHWKKKPIEEIIYEAVPIGDEFAKGFIMDDVKLPTGCLLSGVQFVWNSNLTQGGDLIRIKIQGKRWSANMTDSTNCIMESNPENITRIELSEPDASEFAPNNEILSKPGDYVIFQSTDMKKDVAQSSVPYFDIQSIKKKLHLPLSGIGLYYKGMEGFGGFIALRAFAAEMSSLINPEKIEIYADTMTAFIEKLGSKNITAYTKSLVSWDSK